MTSQDVRSILNLPASAPSGPSAPRRSAAAGPKKPEGISRELYALIGDNAPSLAEAQRAAGVKYRERPKMKGKKVEWREVEFTPFARAGSSLKLKHWARITDDNPEASVEHFAKFNLHGPSVMEYSQYEYDQHLADPSWTPHETAYLFDLLREYDLRFVVAADRYEYRGPRGEAEPRRRSVEDMKDRYYTICRRLVRTRTASDPHVQQQQVQQFTFDKAREVKRKQYASELFHLTAAEIAEEEALYVEVKRLEQNERRFRADRDDLMRTVIGLDSGLVSLEQNNSEGVLNVDRYKKKRRPEDEAPGLQSPAPPPTKKQKEDAANDAALGIYRVPPVAPAANSSHLAQKHPVHQPVHLRSTRLPAPPPSAALRVPEVFAELGLPFGRLVMPTRANIDVYERVLHAAGGLLDMKRQVDRVEQEIRTRRAQRDGFVAPVERKVRSESVLSTDTAGTGRRARAV